MTLQGGRLQGRQFLPSAATRLQRSALVDFHYSCIAKTFAVAALQLARAACCKEHCALVVSQRLRIW